MNNSVFLKIYLLEIAHFNPKYILMVGILLMSCEDSIFNNSDEIKYVNPADWVELFNPTNENIDIGTWIFKDDDNDHNFIIPANQIMSPGMYLVLCRDILEFKDNFPNVINIAGDLGFGLSGGGGEGN